MTSIHRQPLPKPSPHKTCLFSLTICFRSIKFTHRYARASKHTITCIYSRLPAQNNRPIF